MRPLPHQSLPRFLYLRKSGRRSRLNDQQHSLRRFPKLLQGRTARRGRKLSQNIGRHNKLGFWQRRAVRQVRRHPLRLLQCSRSALHQLLPQPAHGPFPLQASGLLQRQKRIRRPASSARPSAGIQQRFRLKTRRFQGISQRRRDCAKSRRHTGQRISRRLQILAQQNLALPSFLAVAPADLFRRIF